MTLFKVALDVTVGGILVQAEAIEGDLVGGAFLEVVGGRIGALLHVGRESVDGLVCGGRHDDVPSPNSSLAVWTKVRETED